MIALNLVIGTLLALVSIACSAILWLSFATTAFDQVLAAVTAAALVACQFIFAISANDHEGDAKHVRLLVAAILILTSMAATIGWLESRYQAQSIAELSNDSSYTQKQQQLQQLNRKLNTLYSIAERDQELEYRTRAKSTLREAEITERKIEKLTKELANASSKSSAGTAVANGLSEWRWALWILLAAIVDICPILCFANVATSSNKERNNTTESPSEQALTAETDDLLEEIRNKIKGGFEPVMRNVISQFGIRHDRAKAIFSALEDEGLIRRNGNRFERVQEPAA